MNKKQIRNWLSIIFMIMAVIGVIMFLSKNELTHMRGLYIILLAICVKITETALRMIK